MAWTTPMTAVANAIFTAAQYNTYVRDNLNQTMVAKATAAGQYFVSDGSHSVSPRTPSGIAVTNTVQTVVTTSGVWSNLTGGALNSVTTGTDVLVHLSAWLRMSSADIAGQISFAVTGATSLTPDDHNNRICWDGTNTVQQTRMGSWGRLSNLTAGSNNFVMQGTSGTGVTLTYNMLHIFVIPLN